jgi:hypothetical protein
MAGNESPPPERRSLFARRRDRIRAEIEANRRGEYVVPTWVLVVILLAFVGAWAAFVMLS